ncbi:MAG: FxsA family protein [Spirochaetota bacterium]
MDRDPLLRALIDPESVLRAYALALLASLLLLADGYVLILVSRMVGIYLLLAAEAATGLLAVTGIFSAYRTRLRGIQTLVARGIYPRAEFRRIIPLMAAAALLVIPGFVTDALGILLLIRPIGWAVGALVERRRRARLMGLYEYLRLHH